MDIRPRPRPRIEVQSEVIKPPKDWTIEDAFGSYEAYKALGTAMANCLYERLNSPGRTRAVWDSMRQTKLLNLAKDVTSETFN